MSEKYYCRYCGALLTEVFIDLGSQPVSNGFIRPEEIDMPETFYPLKTYICLCGLVQIPDYVGSENLFTNDYPYYSSQSPANVSHAKDLVNLIMQRFNPRVVLEIGSNDGYLLQHFPSYVKVLGIEPAAGPANAAYDNHKISTIVGFFSRPRIQEYDLRNRYDIVCSINVLAHQPHLHDFVEGIWLTLKPEGVTIHEFPHLAQLVQGNQFDTIYHEHYSYFSFSLIHKLFRDHGLQVFDVEEIPEHGGSLRVFAQRRNTGVHPVALTVAGLLASEQNAMSVKQEGDIRTTVYYEGFEHRVNAVKNRLLRFLYRSYLDGKRTVAYGAAAKGNTLLNSCNIHEDLIPFIVDRSPHKQGCLLPGSRIPVRTEDDLRAFKPDNVLILPWNLKNEIMDQLSYIREWGGKFVIPIPDVEVRY